MNKLLGQHLNLENRWLWGLIKEEAKTTIDFLKLNDELNPKIWDDQSKLKSQVRIKLLKIAKKFIQFLDMPQVTITDIQFTGSMANYNYSSYSDIDLHILIQYPEDCDNSLKELAQSKKMLWNKEHDIQIYNHQVELYPQDVNEPHTASGLYSVLKNEWIKVPVHREFQIDVDQILTKVRSWNAIIDEADTVEAVNDIKNRIKKMRKSGLEEGGEYSIENLTFKVLRNWGSIEKLNAIKLDKTDKELSLQENKQLNEFFWNKKNKEKSSTQLDQDPNKQDQDPNKQDQDPNKQDQDPNKQDQDPNKQIYEEIVTTLNKLGNFIALSENTETGDIISKKMQEFLISQGVPLKGKEKENVNEIISDLIGGSVDSIGGSIGEFAKLIGGIFSPKNISTKVIFKDLDFIKKMATGAIRGYDKEKQLEKYKKQLQTIQKTLDQINRYRSYLSKLLNAIGHVKAYKLLNQEFLQPMIANFSLIKSTVEIVIGDIENENWENVKARLEKEKEWKKQEKQEKKEEKKKKKEEKKNKAKGPEAKEPNAQSQDNQEEEKNNEDERK